MLSYTIKQFFYSLTVLVVLLAALFWLYKQPIIGEQVNEVYSSFRLYMERFAVKPPEAPPVPHIERLDKNAVEKRITENKLPVPFWSVQQKTPSGSMTFGFDQENRLVLVQKESDPLVFEYDNTTLKRIKVNGKETVFSYGIRGLLMNMTSPKTQYTFHYDKYDRLTTLVLPEKKARFEWDIKDQLTGFKIDEGVPTTFTYADNKRLQSFKKQSRETSIRYDDQRRIRSLQSDDDFMIIHYWRDDLMVSLSGSKYGLKETVTYGPTEIKLISNTDEAIFSGDTEETRIKALHLFLACNKIKHVPVIFEPGAWAIYSNYFKKDIVDYLVNNVVCNALYQTEFD